ncbi:hypothetical protein ACJJTC_014834 [Scirpophaga incertulas]
MVRAAKRRHIHENVLNASAGDVWKCLNSLGFGKSVARLPDNPCFHLDELNRHFSNTLSVPLHTKVATIDEISNAPSLHSNLFSFNPVSEAELIYFAGGGGRRIELARGSAFLEMTVLQSDGFEENLVQFLCDTCVGA